MSEEAIDTLREIIQFVKDECPCWEALSDTFDLCHECGGIPTGSYGDKHSIMFIECVSDNCDIAFERMCEDFIDETGNGNSTRYLMAHLYDLMKENNDLEAFALDEKKWLEGNNIDTEDMSQEDLIWGRLNSFDRSILNERIVDYWKEARKND